MKKTSKKSRSNPAQLKLLLEDVYKLEDRYLDASHLFRLARNACDEGGKWVSVDKVVLTVGRTYWVRRKFAKKSKFEPIEDPFAPALYTWTENGWSGEGYGTLLNTTASNATVEVWV